VEVQKLEKPDGIFRYLPEPQSESVRFPHLSQGTVFIILDESNKYSEATRKWGLHRTVSIAIARREVDG
jgi:hypothetical protein